MSTERYLNHPTFGMLYRVAPVAESRDLYATLYAQRIFFLSRSRSEEPISR